MGALKLELGLPQSIDGLTVDPQPDWTFDSLFIELSSIEKKLDTSPIFPVPFTKIRSRELSIMKDIRRSPRTFAMHISDDEIEDVGSDGDGEAREQFLVRGRRFACDELYISDSDDSGDESALETQYHLMDKVGLVEGPLLELTHEYQISITEEIRNQIVALETDLMSENEKFTSALARVERHTEAKRDIDRKLDMHYQRKIAEALDNHLTAIQRVHEHRSQIEERRIRDDAAFEESKRKEKALQEEKLRQEKIRAEAEARLEAEKKRAEEAKAAALEAERRAAKEAAERVATENLRRASAAVVPLKEADGLQTGSGSNIMQKATSAGNVFKGAARALELEERRLQIYNEVAAHKKALGLDSNKDYRSRGMQVARQIRTISGSKENVRAKTDELIKIFIDSPWPQTISVAMFAEKVVALCINPTKSIFAYGHVIALVTAQSVFDTEETYKKAIGFQEEDGKIESKDRYLERMVSYMKLYGALVQTQAGGVQNLHGLEEGWAWLARFLNALPANLYTGIALHTFLEMAGFALYRKYKSQFKKLLNIISRDFLNALKERGGEDTKINKVITNIQNYIESNQCREEPEGWRLESSLLSKSIAP
ncbi:mRNA export factor GLE1 isoform X2 [Cornus florida]|uniref:mRNA export factor GLE1 isoform X2 n=1 Tax=Cornus florida TaxID=4283 RepID=UPI0028A2C1A2|nr:mRNA export factor GLE1 isoform X2 [Cornus florida]